MSEDAVPEFDFGGLNLNEHDKNAIVYALKAGLGYSKIGKEPEYGTHHLLELYVDSPQHATHRAIVPGKLIKL